MILLLGYGYYRISSAARTRWSASGCCPSRRWRSSRPRSSAASTGRGGTRAGRSGGPHRGLRDLGLHAAAAELRALRLAADRVPEPRAVGHQGAGPVRAVRARWAGAAEPRAVLEHDRPMSGCYICAVAGDAARRRHRAHPGDKIRGSVHASRCQRPAAAVARHGDTRRSASTWSHGSSAGRAAERRIRGLRRRARPDTGAGEHGGCRPRQFHRAAAGRRHRRRHGARDGGLRASRARMSSFDEVLQMLDEATHVIEYSRQLEQKSEELELASRELRAANLRLEELDKLKDEFLTTVDARAAHAADLDPLLLGDPASTIPTCPAASAASSSASSSRRSSG